MALLYVAELKKFLWNAFKKRVSSASSGNMCQVQKIVFSLFLCPQKSRTLLFSNV